MLCSNTKDKLAKTLISSWICRSIVLFAKSVRRNLFQFCLLHAIKMPNLTVSQAQKYSSDSQRAISSFITIHYACFLGNDIFVSSSIDSYCLFVKFDPFFACPVITFCKRTCWDIQSFSQLFKKQFEFVDWSLQIVLWPLGKKKQFLLQSV